MIGELRYSKALWLKGLVIDMADCVMSDNKQRRCRCKVDEKVHPDHLCDHCRELAELDENK